MLSLQRVASQKTPCYSVNFFTESVSTQNFWKYARCAKRMNMYLLYYITTYINACKFATTSLTVIFWNTANGSNYHFIVLSPKQSLFISVHGNTLTTLLY